MQSYSLQLYSVPYYIYTMCTVFNVNDTSEQHFALVAVECGVLGDARALLRLVGSASSQLLLP